MAEILEKHEREGYFRFMFPSPLVPIIREPGRFARLRLQFLLKLNSKYAITLYKVLESVTNLRAPVLEATVEEIRGWLKIPEGKLNQWDYLNKYALSPALTEINSNPELSGINVTHELIRSGRGGKVQKIKFTVNKTNSRVTFEKDIQISKKAKQIAQTSTFISPFQGTTIYEKAKKLASILIPIQKVRKKGMSILLRSKSPRRDKHIPIQK
jgi:plasmid replication initiation protein